MAYKNNKTKNNRNRNSAPRNSAPRNNGPRNNAPRNASNNGGKKLLNIFSSDSKGSMRDFRNISIMLSALLYFLVKFLIIRKAGIVGSAYLYGIYNFVLLIVMSIPVAFTEIVSKHVRDMLDIMSYKNAKRILAFSIFLGLIFDIVITALIKIFENNISLGLTGSLNSLYVLDLFIPYLFLATISSIFKGFFLGLKFKKQLYIAELLEKAGAFLGVLLLSGIYNKSGLKAFALLQDPKILETYHAGGVALGLSVGVLLCSVFCIISYFMNSSYMSLMDETRRTLDVYDLAGKLVFEIILLGVSSTFIFAIPVISQVMFIRNSVAGSSLALYNFTACFGVLEAAMILPVYFSYIYSFLERKTINVNYFGGDRHESSFRVGKFVSHIYKYLIPYCLVVFVLADKICECFAGNSSLLFVEIIRKGIFALLFLVPGIIFMNFLISVNKYMYVIIYGVIALVVNVGTLILTMGPLGMGINGILIALYLFSIIFAVPGLLLTSSIFEVNPDIIRQFIMGLVGGIVGAIVSLLIKLLFNLFAPAFITLFVAIILSVLLIYLVYVKFHMVSYSSVAKSPAAIILVPVGSLFGLSKNDRRKK